MMKPRGIFIAGNWKMNLGPQAAHHFIHQLDDLGYPSKPVAGAELSGKIKVALLVPAVSLQSAKAACVEKKWWKNHLEIGAQNAHFETAGAFTGELSGPLLHELGIQLVLIGHSERRQYFGETNESAGKRMASLLLQGFQVIFCFGETRLERESGRTQETLERQLTEAFHSASTWATEHKTPLLPTHWKNLALAYEPVWAIGTGITASPEQAQEAHAFTRGWLKAAAPGKAPPSATTQILYGGSVTPENFQALLQGDDVDGGLIGGASLKPESFFKLIETGAQVI